MQVSKTRSSGTPPSNVTSFEFPKWTRGSEGDDTNAPILIILPSLTGDAVIALACLAALFNPLFKSALRLNKRIGGLDTQNARRADLRWEESGACVIVPLTAFIAYFKKVISLYQHQAENCRVLVLSLVSF